MNMKQNHRKRNIVLFLLLLAVLLAGSSALVSPSDYEAYDILAVERKVQAMSSEPENSLDVLFLGDSESCDVYSPVQLYGEQGFTSYNTGSRAQRITDAYAILQEELKRQNPKVIVLEVNTLFTKNTLFNTSDEAEMVMEEILPITHYHSFYKIFRIPEIIAGMNTEYDRASALKGFWYRKQSVPYTGRKDYMKNVTKEVHMSSGAQSYLEKIAALAKEKDIPLLLISSPSPKNWTEGKKLAISDWAEQNNVTFIDLNEKLDEIGIDWNTDSLDLGDHVNFNGTLKINQYIGAYLKEQYGLIDHREDSTYQSWTDLYQTTSIYTKQ
jgi:hypothetical protein